MDDPIAPPRAPTMKLMENPINMPITPKAIIAEPGPIPIPHMIIIIRKDMIPPRTAATPP